MQQAAGTIQDLSNHAGQVITAIGALGTAAFGLVDASKVFWGGPNRIGFEAIKRQVQLLLPQTKGMDPIETLRANWYNGTDLASQKAIAKSLIKLKLAPANAAALAEATGVDTTALGKIAAAMVAGVALTPEETDFLARFDLTLTAMLDQTYQHADQVYRNGTRAFAMAVAVILACVGTWYVPGITYPQAILIGLLATPIAPIAKDLSTALAAAVNTLQQVKK